MVKDLLTSATKCAILDKAGPHRSRNLANLYKDERTRKAVSDKIIFDILEKT